MLGVIEPDSALKNLTAAGGGTVVARGSSHRVGRPELIGMEGMVRMPRVYVLDADGKIVWFDIEYSQSTQRELKQAIEALTGK